jgi:hypothetical protein
MAFFAKCSAAQRLLNQHAKMGLRAKRRFLKSARKMRLSVTGKSPFF